MSDDGLVDTIEHIISFIENDQERKLEIHAKAAQKFISEITPEQIIGLEKALSRASSTNGWKEHNPVFVETKDSYLFIGPQFQYFATERQPDATARKPGQPEYSVSIKQTIPYLGMVDATLLNSANVELRFALSREEYCSLSAKPPVVSVMASRDIRRYSVVGSFGQPESLNVSFDDVQSFGGKQAIEVEIDLNLASIPYCNLGKESLSKFFLNAYAPDLPRFLRISAEAMRDMGDDVIGVFRFLGIHAS
ncbi:MAG: hypothetical protein AABX51_08410, partial [Nanoarchaeota archaeon]